MSLPPAATARVGCDVVSVARLQAVLARNPPAFARDLFTERELAIAAQDASPQQARAKMFAAKESVMKALGLGLGQGIRASSIELLSVGDEPELRLTGPAAALLQHHRLQVRTSALFAQEQASNRRHPREGGDPAFLSDQRFYGRKLDSRLRGNDRFTNSDLNQSCPSADADFAQATCLLLPVADAPAISLLLQRASSARLTLPVLGRRFWPQRAFSNTELAVYAERKQAAAALAARLLVKRLASLALRQAGYEARVHAAALQVGAEPSGRPVLLWPLAVERCLQQRQLQLEVSLAHAGPQVLAAVLVVDFRKLQPAADLR